jgi:DNA modification methylase
MGLPSLVSNWLQILCAYVVNCTNSVHAIGVNAKSNDTNKPSRRRPAHANPTRHSSHPALRDRIVGLRRVKAAELLPDPKNWRRHPPAQAKALRAVLAQVGLADACLVRRTEAGLVLIDGHLRRELAPDALLPVLVLDVTEGEAETLLATLDPLAGMAVADPDALRALLGTAVIPDAALLEHIRALLPDAPPAGRCDPDAVPPRPRRSSVKPGELWAMGEHRLLCGDAASVQDLNRLTAGRPVDLLWTDPPYGVSYVGKTKEALTLSNDDPGGMDDLLERAFGAVDAVLRPGAALYVTHPAGALSVTFGQAFIRAGWRLHQTLVWAKDRMVLGHADYHYRHEPILYGYKPGPGRWGRGHQGWQGDNDQDSILEVPRPAASRNHPTAKPVELITRCLANSSAQGEVVLDPFAGSGSTLIAGEEQGRVVRLVEIDPLYCQVILDRWKAFTGKRAVRVDG